jgi:hypothetical protein
MIQKGVDNFLNFYLKGVRIHRIKLDNYNMVDEYVNPVLYFNISGYHYIPEEFDNCSIIELPSDEEDLKVLREACLYAPMFDRGRQGEVINQVYDPDEDAFYVKWELFDVRFRKDECVADVGYWKKTF